MVGFELPRNLIRETECSHPSRNAWMAALPKTVADLSDRWALDVGRPYQPGGMSSWVAPARAADGARLVLKLGWRHDEALHEADGLRVWGGNATVRLIDAYQTGQTDALLLESCEPGVALSRLLPELKRDVIVADLMRRLWLQPPDGHPFRLLTTMCDAWADEFEREYATTHRVWLDPGVVRAGIELFRSLPRYAERSVLLCTDLHPENVLASQREPWLVIDPKPYVGDPTYDPLQHMLNFPDRLSSAPQHFVERMAGLLGLDPDRLRQWLFARCVQESLRMPHLQAVAAQLAHLI